MNADPVAGSVGPRLDPGMGGAGLGSFPAPRDCAAPRAATWKPLHSTEGEGSDPDFNARKGHTSDKIKYCVGCMAGSTRQVAEQPGLDCFKTQAQDAMAHCQKELLPNQVSTAWYLPYLFTRPTRASGIGHGLLSRFPQTSKATPRKTYDGRRLTRGFSMA
jgi:hypothetical protein